MPQPTTLTPRKTRFAEAYAQHHNGSQAAREAGYSTEGRSASVTATRLLADVCVLERIQALEADAARELGVSRQRFLYELQEAAALAMEKREPMAAIAAWREIGKACGFYQAERIKVDVNVAAGLEMAKWNQFSDAELLALIASGGGATAAN